MTNDLIPIAITVADAQIAQDKIILMDQDKKRFSIWKNTQDGNESKAYQAIKPYALDLVGKMIKCSYKETQGTNQKGMPVTYRDIRWIKRIDDASVQVNDTYDKQQARHEQSLVNDPTPELPELAEMKQLVKTLETQFNVLKGRLDQMSGKNANTGQNTPPTAPPQPDQITLTDIPFK